MVIICECHAKIFIFPSKKELFDKEILENIISRKILIGSCTIKSVADIKARENDFEMFHFLSKNSIRDPIQLIEIDSDDYLDSDNENAIVQSNEKVE
jgi:hypothetical protein